MSGPIRLSVVVPTRRGWAGVARTLRCLAAQSVAAEIELVLVVLAPTPAGPTPAEVARLGRHVVVALEHGPTVATAYAAGVRRATAPVIAFGEDHAFPQPGWAQALLDRHAEGWAVVGPVVRNANPASAVSWADFVLGYGPFAEGHGGGAVDVAPGHNSAYRRDVLERQGDALEAMLEAEWLLHLQLRTEGERICLEPRAVIEHVNFALWRAFVPMTFRAARSGAAARAANWPAFRRAAYVAGSPLIPLVRLPRTLGEHRPPVRALPAFAVGLVLDALGQAAGFARPPAATGRADFELDRLRFVTREDRERLAA